MGIPFGTGVFPVARENWSSLFLGFSVGRPLFVPARTGDGLARFQTLLSVDGSVFAAGWTLRLLFSSEPGFLFLLFFVSPCSA